MNATRRTSRRSLSPAIVSILIALLALSSSSAKKASAAKDAAAACAKLGCVPFSICCPEKSALRAAELHPNVFL